MNCTTLLVIVAIIIAFLMPTMDRHVEPLVTMMEMETQADAAIDIFAAWVRPVNCK